MKFASNLSRYKHSTPFKVPSFKHPHRRVPPWIGRMLAGGLLLCACSAHSGTSISLYTPGTAEQIVGDITTLEFSDHGAAVITGAGPSGTPFNVGNFYTTRIMTHVAGFGRKGDAVPDTQVRAGLNQAFGAGGYEITMVATLVDFALQSTATASTSELIGGLVRWYYDDTSAGGVQASLPTGAGYDDGTMILEATIAGGRRVLNGDGVTGSGQFVDFSVVDSFLDHGVIGGLSHELFTNLLRISGNLSYPVGAADADHYFTGGTSYAFSEYNVAQCEPSDTTHGQCDLKLRFDASSHFVPEPGSLTLVTGMMFAMGGAGLRRKTHSGCGTPSLTKAPVRPLKQVTPSDDK